MQDHELKKLLLETCPVRPGQEERAWTALKGRFVPQARWAWLYYPTWRGAMVGVGAVVTLIIVGSFFGMQTSAPSLVSADSQAPGIYATAFYSKSAKAQVVWLNGLQPATDQPTYLDPTTDTSSLRTETSHPSASQPNSL